jgi:hypothetical protein
MVMWVRDQYLNCSREMCTGTTPDPSMRGPEAAEQVRRLRGDVHASYRHRVAHTVLAQKKP